MSCIRLSTNPLLTTKQQAQRDKFLLWNSAYLLRSYDHDSISMAPATPRTRNEQQVSPWSRITTSITRSVEGATPNTSRCHQGTTWIMRNHLKRHESTLAFHYHIVSKFIHSQMPQPHVYNLLVRQLQKQRHSKVIDSN